MMPYLRCVHDWKIAPWQVEILPHGVSKLLFLGWYENGENGGSQ